MRNKDNFKEKVIDMANRNGTFVPVKVHYESARVRKPNTIKEHKPPALSVQNILVGIAMDFFKTLRREMFR